jgi:Ca2+-binding RTX toxin-like protein
MATTPCTATRTRWTERPVPTTYGGDGRDVYGGDIEDPSTAARVTTLFAGTSAVRGRRHGGAGNDKLYGEAIDEMYTRPGTINDAGDTDLALGDSGNDIMFGGDGPDELRGGVGDDILSGGSGADMLKGEQGDDIFLAGIGQAAQVGDADEALGDVGFDMTSFSDVSIVLDTAADLLPQSDGNQRRHAVPAVQSTWADIGCRRSVRHTIIGATGIDAEGVNPGTTGWSAVAATIRSAPGSGRQRHPGSGGNDVIVGDQYASTP